MIDPATLELWGSKATQYNIVCLVFVDYRIYLMLFLMMPIRLTGWEGQFRRLYHQQQISQMFLSKLWENLSCKSWVCSRIFGQKHLSDTILPGVNQSTLFQGFQITNRKECCLDSKDLWIDKTLALSWKINPTLFLTIVLINIFMAWIDWLVNRQFCGQNNSCFTFQTGKAIVTLLLLPQ